MLQTKKHTYERVRWYVVCFMLLICTFFSDALSAAYAPNMGSQGITMHNKHHLQQADNVFDVPFAQNNLNNNALVEQGSMQQENDLLSLPLLVPSSSFFSNELPRISSLHPNGLNNNKPLNDQASMVWDQLSMRLNPSPCFTQLTATPFCGSLANSYNNQLIQQSSLNHGQQPNNGLFNDGSSIGWNNNARTDFNASPCFTQPTTAPCYASLANNYNEPPIQNNLKSYQHLNIPLPTFRSQEQQCIGLQEKSILGSSNIPKFTNLITTIDNEKAPRAVDFNALLPVTDAFSQRKKRKVTLQTPHKSESVPLIDLARCSQSVKAQTTPHKSESVPLIALARRSQSATPQTIYNTKKNKFTCYLCNKRFLKKSSVTRHIKSAHFKEKRHKCSHCGKRFAQSGNLKRHLRTHTGEKSHPCLVCKKSFIRNDSLKKHVQEVHTKKKPFVCIVCDRSYTQKNSLFTHIKNTHFKNNYDCPKCNKPFARPEGLKKHIETIHLKMYQCPKKGIHINKKMYNCPKCERKFDQIGNLNSHILRDHDQEKMFKCDLCDKKYTQKHSLKTHMKNRHSDVS